MPPSAPNALDELSQRLLNALQVAIPLVPSPWAALAAELGTTESEILARLSALRTPQPPARPLIRQISAIFDSKSLGYASTLIAARIEEAHLEEAAAIINRHPGVSHNYRRNHAFNLWYTLAVPPDSALGLERTVDILHRQSGALSTRMLPTLKLFKIGVKFDLTADADAPVDTTSVATTAAPAYDESRREAASSRPLTETDKRLIRILQQDLPLIAEPFAPWAAQAGVTVAELLAAASDYLSRGLMRRFSAVLRHREAGFSANAMGVWAVPADPSDAQDTFGRAAAAFPAVSHCYLRRSYPDWPYTLFTMVHAPTQPDCEKVLAAISAATGVRDYAALYSTKEYKKVRVQYFLPDIPAWEQAVLATPEGRTP